MALQSKLMGLALETEESTSACMFAFIRKFTEAAKRQAQNERIKVRRFSLLKLIKTAVNNQVSTKYY